MRLDNLALIVMRERQSRSIFENGLLVIKKQLAVRVERKDMQGAVC